MHDDAIAVLEAELHTLRAKATAVEAAIAALRGDAPRALTPIAPMSTDGVPTDSSSRSIAARIDHARLGYGWSQRELSRRAGLNVSQITNILALLRRGGNVRIDTLRAIADALGVTQSWLVGGAP